MKRLLIPLLLLFYVLAPHKSTAGHFVGGHFEYTCLGNDSFFVELSLYSYCGSIGIPSQVTVSLTNSCGVSTTYPLQVLLDPTTGNPSTIVSQVCSADSLNTECDNGNLPGIDLNRYGGIIGMNAFCSDWTIAFNTCCRSGLTNTSPSAFDNTYIYTTIHMQNNSCNNSPVFINKYLPLLCVNQTHSFAYSASDTEGDSLVYALVASSAGAGQPIQYGASYTGAQPIQVVAIDSSTGLMTVTPNQIGSFVVAVKVEQFDCSGAYLGEVVYDVYLNVINCSGSVPSSTGNFSNLTGGVVQTGPNKIEACAGQPFCFDYQISDPDANDSLKIIENVGRYWPGATMSVIGSNPVTVTVCWLAPASCTGYWPLGIQASDQTCPFPNKNVMPIDLFIIDATEIHGQELICGSGSILLNATGGTSFTWSSIAGDPINVPSNFSCNNCPNPIISPSQTTTYVVQSNLSGSCANSDTITVVVDPGFSLSFTETQYGATACAIDSVRVQLQPSVPGSYTYQWNASADISDVNSDNPTISNAFPGTHSYFVTVTNAAGCTQTLSYSYTNNALNVDAANSSPSICTGASTQLFAYVNGVVADTNNYSVSWSPATNLSTTNGSTTFANPSSSTMYFADITDLSNGCTYMDSVLVNVSTPLTYTITPSTTDPCESTFDLMVSPDINNHAYQWISSSTAFLNTNSGTNATANLPSAGTYTFTVMIDDSAGCISSASYTVDYVQPIATASALETLICFGDSTTLSALGLNAGETVAWSPAAFATTPNASNTIVTPLQSTMFELVITDSSGSCSDSDSLLITVIPAFNTNPISGPVVVNPATISTYTTTGNPNSNYIWSIVSGTGVITSGQGTNTVDVYWGNVGANGVLQVIEVDPDGCKGTPATINVDITVGIDEVLTNEVSFALEPNPANHLVSLVYTGTTAYDYQIMDIAGKLYFDSKSNTAKKQTLNVSPLPAGVYLVRLSDQSGYTGTQRLIITK